VKVYVVGTRGGVQLRESEPLFRSNTPIPHRHNIISFSEAKEGSNVFCQVKVVTEYKTNALIKTKNALRFVCLFTSSLQFASCCVSYIRYMKYIIGAVYTTISRILCI
jgi:hypothetical protein